MKKLFFYIGLLFVTNVYSQLGTFNSELLQKKVFNKTIKLPYLDKNSYYGYIDSEKSPDEVRGGKSYYYFNFSW